MKAYEAYLFDWDGTLGRTLELWLEVYREQLNRYGIHNLTDDQIAAGFGRLMHADKDFGIPVAKLEQFMLDVQREASQRVINVELYDGAADMLARLKAADKKLALITTSWRDVMEVALARHNLSGTFAVVVSGDDVKTHKPDPEGIRTALERLGVKQSAAVMIGDSDKDLGAARNAGIDSVLFYPPSHQLFYNLRELKTLEPAVVIDAWNKLVVPAS